MQILVIGSGGREHALVWKLAQSPRVKKIFCLPGNGGIESIAECVTLSQSDLPKIISFVKDQSIDLTVVGPEAPLSLGIVDAFEKEGLKIFGPRKNAAVIEYSKLFTKEFCTRHNIPTAPYRSFSDSKTANAYLKKESKFPVVIKADGLAAGKGVIIAKNQTEAIQAVEDMLLYEKFGDAGRKIVIEDFMPGEEATFMAITDGEHVLPLATSQDHKRIFDNDEGPNTGGMGAYSPAPVVTPAIHDIVMKNIITPLVVGMKEEGRFYRGVIYAGLMIANGQPRLVEFNCRFGDPEAQVILSRLDTDLVEVLEHCIEGTLNQIDVTFTQKHCVSVVMASKGYPGEYDSGKEIKGLEKLKDMKDLNVFHSGTRKVGEKIVTNGGRVLAVTALGESLKAAIEKAYGAVEKITWDGVQYRKDIGKKGI